jgi:hypothetical protein
MKRALYQFLAILNNEFTYNTPSCQSKNVPICSTSTNNCYLCNSIIVSREKLMSNIHFEKHLNVTNVMFYTYIRVSMLKWRYVQQGRHVPKVSCLCQLSTYVSLFCWTGKPNHQTTYLEPILRLLSLQLQR